MLALIGLLGLLASDPFVPAASPPGLEPAWEAPLGSLRNTSIVGTSVVGDLVLVEDARHGITAVHGVSGQPVWFVELPEALSQPPVAGDGRIALSAGTQVLVVDALTGHRVHEYASASISATGPVADAGAVYVPSLLRNRLVAVDLASGLQAWELRLPAGFATSAHLIGDEGRRSVLIGTEDGVLRAVPAGPAVPDGERWIARVGLPIGEPVVDGAHLLLTTRGRALYALEVASGQVAWQHLPGEAFLGAPVVVDDLVVAGTRTALIAVSRRDGQPVWSVGTAARPLGRVGDAVLVWAGHGEPRLRRASDGVAIDVPVPDEAFAAGGMLVSVRAGTTLLGSRLIP